MIRAAGAGGDPAALAVTLVPPIHMYRQLRGACGLGRVSALLRTILLLIFAMMAASLFMLLLVALGVLG